MFTTSSHQLALLGLPLTFLGPGLRRSAGSVWPCFAVGVDCIGSEHFLPFENNKTCLCLFHNLWSSWLSCRLAGRRRWRHLAAADREERVVAPQRAADGQDDEHRILLRGGFCGGETDNVRKVLLCEEDNTFNSSVLSILYVLLWFYICLHFYRVCVTKTLEVLHSFSEVQRSQLNPQEATRGTR